MEKEQQGKLKVTVNLPKYKIKIVLPNNSRKRHEGPEDSSYTF